MKRAFIVSKESKYYKHLKEYRIMRNSQRKFVDNFLKSKGIEANFFYVGGDGLCNEPFDQNEINNIQLSILPTENDKRKLGKILSQPKKYGLCSFRKNSKINKEFAQSCIDKKIVINLLKPRIADYFKSIYSCAYECFTVNDIMYVTVDNDRLKAEDTPEGFTEIKLSEYYKSREEYMEKEKLKRK